MITLVVLTRGDVLRFATHLPLAFIFRAVGAGCAELLLIRSEVYFGNRLQGSGMKPRLTHAIRETIADEVQLDPVLQPCL